MKLFTLEDIKESMKTRSDEKLSGQQAMNRQQQSLNKEVKSPNSAWLLCVLKPETIWNYRAYILSTLEKDIFSEETGCRHCFIIFLIFVKLCSYLKLECLRSEWEKSVICNQNYLIAFCTITYMTREGRNARQYSSGEELTNL